MATDKIQPWFVEKRARAFVYSLLAERNLSIRDETQQDLGVDLLIDLRKDGRELGRYLAVQLMGFGEFPSVSDLNKKIARQIPQKVREELVLPFAVFVVQVKGLAAVYAWINEPFVEDGSAVLRPPLEYEWAKLDDKAIDGILKQVDQFWDTLLKPVLKTGSQDRSR
jgi:hypothetical protein